MCPAEFTIDADRAQLSTEVLIGRRLPGEFPEAHWFLHASPTPTTGEAFLNGSTQPESTRLLLSRTSSDDVAMTAWLRYINVNSRIRLADSDESGKAMGFVVNSTPTLQANWLEIPIAWQDGTTEVPLGEVTVTVNLGPELPTLYFDAFGRTHYGRETFQRTDLISATRDLFSTLADRILEVRGSNSIPRVDSVTISAATGSTFPMLAMELQSTARPEKPSRYRLRLQITDRQVYDRMCFVASVRHVIERDNWSTTLSLDHAEWAAQL